MRTLLIVILIPLTQQFSFAQDTARARFRIMTLPSQFLFCDFPVTFEKYFKQQTLGLTVSYRPSQQNSGNIKPDPILNFSDFRLDENFATQIYNGITVGVNSKYLLGKKNNLFLEVNLFYRYWWFENKECYYYGGNYMFMGTRTEKQNVYCAQILFGRSFTYKTKYKIKPIMDLYCGLGLRYKTYIFETYKGIIDNMYYTYYKETGNSWDKNWDGPGDPHRMTYGVPISVQLGMKIGIGM